MGQNRREMPYKTLGSQLRNLRNSQQKTLLEVSGAVEIDPRELEEIETGQKKPSEDLLELLISYFGLADSEADRLWSLASYDSPDNPMEELMSKQIAMIMPIDSRVIYTDLVQASINPQGLVLNFMQQNGPDGQPIVASRLGMSHEHAQALLKLLGKTLESAEPKALPAPKSKSDKQRRN